MTFILSHLEGLFYCCSSTSLSAPVGLTGRHFTRLCDLVRRRELRHNGSGSHRRYHAGGSLQRRRRGLSSSRELYSGASCPAGFPYAPLRAEGELYAILIDRTGLAWRQ